LSARAELLEDAGAAAASEKDFFRSPQFLEAEGVTHSLRIESEGGELLAPLIVRPIPGSDARDAISPYGYPGFGGRGAVDPEEIDWGATGLVSAFVRNTLAEPLPLAGAGERNLVQIADPALPRKQRSSDRNQINRNRRKGYEVKIVPGPEAAAAERAGFLAAYEGTMHRAAAAERYFFAERYFELILDFERCWLALALAANGEVAAASIAALSDGYLHYYLSGSLDSHLRDSPMKNVVAALVELSAELEAPLNLGGGISAGDALEDFKRGFANREQAWRTSELVCDPAAYGRLSESVAGDSPDGFFPAYRRPA
jgi:Acetyltransferase (GNAT) domain